MTKYLNIEGVVKWAKVYEPDEFMNDTRYKLDFYPANQQEWDKINSAGLMLTQKTDAEGGKFVTFRRQVRKVFPKDDEATYFTPPEIRGAVNVQYVNPVTNTKVRSYKRSEVKEVRTVGEQVMIPNGSEAVVNISVYPTSKGSGHRLESLTITKLAEFEEKPVEEEVQEFSKDMNDEIPF